MSFSHDVAVAIVRAEGLRAADSNGKSDPYVSYTRLGISHTSKTKVIEKTLDPVWDERFSWVFQFDEPDWTACFEVWDKDTIGKDFLGYAEINLKNLVKEKKLEHNIALDLGGGPKTKEKDAKKVTGKLHIRVNFSARTILDEAERTKIDRGTNKLSTTQLNSAIEFFREVSGGVDTITTKQQMAQLAQHRPIFTFFTPLTISEDKNAYTQDMMAELVKEEELVDYFSHIILTMTDSTLEKGISLSDFVLAVNVADTTTYPEGYNTKEKLESWHFRVMDFDKDGMLSYNDILAFQAITAHGIKAKMQNEFLKDPKVAALKGKMGNRDFTLLFDEMFKKFKYESEQRSLVLRMVVEMETGGYEAKISREKFMAWYKDSSRQQAYHALIKMRIREMLKEHNREAQTVLNGALHKHGCN